MVKPMDRCHSEPSYLSIDDERRKKLLIEFTASFQTETQS